MSSASASKTHLLIFGGCLPLIAPRKIIAAYYKEYSAAMRQLLKSQKYNHGKRPSEHDIGETSFLTNNAGAIPSNVISISNTQATSDYLEYCKLHNLPRHPARMPVQLVEFFIKFLTEPGDLVLDPFAGSNTTGAAAENLKRKWLAIEPNPQYIAGSRGRFSPAAAQGAMNMDASGRLAED